MNSKSIFLSKTFWVNIIGILIEIGLLFTDTFKSNPNVIIYVGFAIGVANIILRSITSKPVHFVEEK